MNLFYMLGLVVWLGFMGVVVNEAVQSYRRYKKGHYLP